MNDEKPKYRKPKIQEDIEFMGLLPPSAVDLEVGVLGAILFEKEALIKVLDIIQVDSFYKTEHALIYKAIKSLFDRNRPIDILTVVHELRHMGELDMVGGAHYVSSLTSQISSSANIESHARIIAEKYILRQIIVLSNETKKLAYDNTTDVFDVLDLHNSTMNKILVENIKEDAIPIKSLTGELLSEVAKRQASDNAVSGISTYIRSVDEILCGLNSGDLVYIAARPSIGKTAFVLSVALEQAKQGVPVAIFSLEMTKIQVVYRLVALITGIDLEDLMKRKLDETRLMEVNKQIGYVESLPIYIDDTAGLSVFDFRAKITRLKKKHDIQVCYIDYIQLMTAPSKKNTGNREQEVSTISKTMKIVAKECGIPVVSLAQLSRAVESRSKTDRRPLLSDLRESGSLEQDADAVGFLYRDEYYGITEDHNGESTRGIGELILAKNRNGKLGIAKMKFTPNLAKYSDIESRYWTSMQSPVKLDDGRSENIKPNRNWVDGNNKDNDETPF